MELSHVIFYRVLFTTRIASALYQQDTRYAFPDKSIWRSPVDQLTHQYSMQLGQAQQTFQLNIKYFSTN